MVPFHCIIAISTTHSDGTFSHHVAAGPVRENYIFIQHLSFISLQKSGGLERGLIRGREMVDWVTRRAKTEVWKGSFCYKPTLDLCVPYWDTFHMGVRIVKDAL